jgi:hypothetical protein
VTGCLVFAPALSAVAWLASRSAQRRANYWACAPILIASRFPSPAAGKCSHWKGITGVAFIPDRKSPEEMASVDIGAEPPKVPADQSGPLLFKCIDRDADRDVGDEAGRLEDSNKLSF